jgi:hypothetical protein
MDPLLHFFVPNYLGPIGSTIQVNIEKHLLNVWLQLSFLHKHGLTPQSVEMGTVKANLARYQG